MNLVFRKIALVEQNMIAREEEARISGYTSEVIDQEFKRRITDLMDRVRYI